MQHTFLVTCKDAQGLVFKSLLSFLNREDFTYLISAVPVTPQTQVLRAMLLYELGELSQQDKASAIALWQQAAALEGGVWSERAKERLSL